MEVCFKDLVGLNEAKGERKKQKVRTRRRFCRRRGEGLPLIGASTRAFVAGAKKRKERRRGRK